MKVVLPLNGSINKDVSPLYIDSEKGEVLSRKNCRVTSTDGGRVGINVSIKGMEKITPVLPSGTNKVIGFVEDKEREQAFYFVYNSLFYHGIYKLKNDVVTNLNADQYVLDFNINEIIDADILGDTCVFVSDYNPPRKFDVTCAIYPTTDLSDLDELDIQLAVRPPVIKPTTQLASDDGRVVNKMVGKTFQFASMYLYKDYTYSVLSPYSDLVVSSAVFSAESNTYDDTNYIGNYVQVGYDLGSDNVKSVRLLAREGNIGDWFLVEEYEKNGESEYAIRTYPFYNDVARQGLAEKAALDLYSDVPREAGTVLAVQNRIGLGRVKKGYNKTKPAVSYAVEYEDVTLSNPPDDLAITDGVNGAGEYAYINLAMPATVAEGDIISFNIRNGRFSNTTMTNQWYFFFEYAGAYTVQAGDDVTDVMDYFMYDILAKGMSIVTELTVGETINIQVSSQQPIGGSRLQTRRYLLICQHL